VTKLETVFALDANIHLAGKQVYAAPFRRQPPLEQLGLSPGLKHDAHRSVNGSRNDQLTLELPFDHRAVLRGVRSLSVLSSTAAITVSVPDTIISRFTGVEMELTVGLTATHRYTGFRRLIRETIPFSALFLATANIEKQAAG